MKREHNRRLIDVDEVGRWELLYQRAANNSSRALVQRLAAGKENEDGQTFDIARSGRSGASNGRVKIHLPMD